MIKKTREDLYWFKSTNPTSSLDNSTLELLVPLLNQVCTKKFAITNLKKQQSNLEHTQEDISY